MYATTKCSLNGLLMSQGIKFLITRFVNKKQQKKKIDQNYFSWTYPDEYQIENVKLRNAGMYLITNSLMKQDKIIYFLHGGSYVSGLSKMYYRISMKYLKLFPHLAFAMLDYRVAPKHVFPAALDDALDGWQYLIKKGYQSNDIIMVGDSAGGNLAVSLTMILRDNQNIKPNSLVLMSPWTDMNDKGASRIYNLYCDPMFGMSEKGQKRRLPNLQYAGHTDLENKYLSPIYGSCDNLPPILIQVGTNEILESDSINLYKKIVLAGGKIKLSRYQGMFHGFQFVGNILPETRIAWQEIREFINLRTK